MYLHVFRLRCVLFTDSHLYGTFTLYGTWDGNYGTPWGMALGTGHGWGCQLCMPVKLYFLASPNQLLMLVIQKAALNTLRQPPVFYDGHTAYI